MGSRGRKSCADTRQYSMEDMARFSRISRIIAESDAARKAMITAGNAGTDGSPSPSIFKKCACCREFTIPAGTRYERCPNCNWIDDPYQNTHPNSYNGMNRITLSQARKEYARQNK